MSDATPAPIAIRRGWEHPREYRLTSLGADMRIPEHMWGLLLRYIYQHEYPYDDFLEAIISNDLRGACRAADWMNLPNIPAFVGYLHSFSPSDCWGSREKLLLWVCPCCQRPEGHPSEADGCLCVVGCPNG